MFANVIARSDLSTGKSQHGRMGGACETHHLYKMQLMGIASAFRLRSASYGGQVAPPILARRYARPPLPDGALKIAASGEREDKAA